MKISFKPKPDFGKWESRPVRACRLGLSLHTHFQKTTNDNHCTLSSYIVTPPLVLVASLPLCIAFQGRLWCRRGASAKRTEDRVQNRGARASDISTLYSDSDASSQHNQGRGYALDIIRHQHTSATSENIYNDLIAPSVKNRLKGKQSRLCHVDDAWHSPNSPLSLSASVVNRQGIWHQTRHCTK